MQTGKGEKSILRLRQVAAAALTALASFSPALGQETTDEPQARRAALEEAHERYLRSGDIQSDLPLRENRPPPKRIEPNGFWRMVGEFLRSIAPLFKILLWVLTPTLLLIILAAILRETTGFRFGFGKKKAQTGAVEIGYTPNEAHARTLLEDADKLAAEGRFEAAARLLLTRSIEDIETLRATRIGRALTAREIGRMDAIPDNARPAFASIAGVVERAVFASQTMTREGFLEARDAYERFALPEAWR